MDDPRVSFLVKHILQAFRSVSQQRLLECMSAEPLKHIVNAFLESPDVQTLFVKEARTAVPVEMYLQPTPSRASKDPLFYFVKLHAARVSEKDVAREVLYGDVTGDPVDHMSMLTEHVFHPIVSDEDTAAAWSEMIVRDTRTNIDSFVSNVQITQGNVQGRTYLPLPNGGRSQEAEEAEDSSGTASQVHSLESAIIVWTKQIKNVLKQSPEMVLETQNNPGPIAEIMFWKCKADNLNGIFDQLQSASVRRVLKVLDRSKSTYNVPFAKICKEVFYARAEAANVTKFLSPLSVWCDFFVKERDFSNVEKYFAPIMHVILLVWKSSPYYNVPSRLVVLLREICNSLILHIEDYLCGDLIMEAVCAEDSSAALQLLENGIRCIGKFKAAYFEYKELSVLECPENPWRMQNNAVFVRLDGFLERCHDVLEMAETIAMFSKLSRTEVGGTKGKTLTTSVGNIYSDFSSAVASMRAVSRGILDLSNKSFEEEFYEFRTRMKELDRRLGSVVVQALDDASTVTGKFRVLDTFENLVFRAIVAEELEKKHASLVAAVRGEVEEARKTFNAHVASPPLAHNHPPIAGALTWSRGLLERVQLPVDKLKSFDKKLLERDDSRETMKLYTIFVGELSDFERANIEAWSASIETSSQVKLKNSILRRERREESGLPLELLYVNFDPLIVNLLRESKYFILLGLSIPDRAADIFKQAEVFRRHTGNLDLIVNLYNDIQTSLLPVERPLVKVQLDKLDKTLAQGFSGDKGAAKPLSWKSSGIEAFIAEAMAEVRDVSDVVQTLQENLKLVEITVAVWRAHPLFERSGRTEVMDDFIAHQAATLKTKLISVSEGGLEIHRLIKDTNKRLKVSHGLPDWKAYVDFINNAVCFGLIEAMAASLVAMSNQFDPVYIEKNVTSPPIEIQLDLVSKSVKYIPEVGYVLSGGASGPKTGIKNIVEYWIEGMFGLSSAFLRVDGAEGSYLREISEAAKVRDQLAAINVLLQATEDSANKVRKQFQKYESLWLADLQANLNDLLDEALEVTLVRFTVDADRRDRDERSPSMLTRSSTSPSGDSYETWEQRKLDLTLFDEKISELLETQDAIADMKSLYEIDALKINAQPVKQAISTWVTKGLYTYTHYLQNFVTVCLADINLFLKDTNAGLDKKVEAGQRETIIYVMTYIRAVRKRMPEIFFNFIQLDSIVALLKKHSISIDMAQVRGLNALDFLEIGKAQWDALVNKAFRVKEILQPLQMSMVDSVVRDVATFEKTLESSLKTFRLNGPFHLIEGKKNDPYGALDKFHKELSGLSEQSKVLIDTEGLFELPRSRHVQLVVYASELNSLKTLWDLFFLIDHVVLSWRHTLWAELDCDGLLDEGKRIDDQLKQSPPFAKEWDVYKLQEAKLKNTLVALPLIKDLHSPAIRERHWKSVAAVTGTTLNRGPTFALSDLLDSNIYLHIEALSDIVEMASKELKIESRLASIEEVWIKLNLGFESHKGTDLMILKPPDEVLEVLDEHSLQLQNMAGMGKFVDFFREQVVEWQSTLGEVESNLKLLLTVSRLWTSLESIFLGSDDIRTQLPDDANRFDAADSVFRALMAEMQENTFLIDCCTFQGRDQIMQQVLKELERCEYSLNEYLEIKKSIFPRFYFVSNAALLDILSNSNSPTKVGNYIGSLFDGIGKLDFCLSSKQKSLVKKTGEIIAPAAFKGAKAMVSKDKERIDFPSVFEMNGNVERWLNELVSFAQTALRGELANSMDASTVWDSTLPGDPREEWVFTAAAQICLLSSQIVWTDDLEKALEKYENGNEDALKKFAEKCTGRLDALIKLAQGDLDDGDRVKIINVITSDVHCRDIVLSLINKKVETALDFNWQSQLRFYWDADPDVNNVNVRVCDFSTLYSFEYIGNCSRLVITPLTDRCFVTLTVALKLFLGGAPAGPAGTGKTETTKDLSRCLGVACYVFNCSNQMNYKTLGDIFKGLTQVGAWGCFDEFNRIEIEVLSVVASQVRCILKALSFFSVPANRPVEYQSLPAGSPPTKVGSFDFFGYTMNLIPTVGIFITMNPGYAGRSELPENLKSQFRSCAMVQPDFLPIAENMLMAEGFIKARPMSVKFVTLYKLSAELLSKQDHYDWGLRAMKSVLRVAGELKRADDDLEEEVVLMRALRDFNSPKITSSDLPIFLRLISDIFPGIVLANKGNDKLKSTCVEVCELKRRQSLPSFVSKMIQFQEILNVRHSVMLLGPPGSGKSTVWRTLCDCHNYQKNKHVTVFETVNPKAVTTDELYGYMTLTKDWRDGIISSIMRNMSQNTSPFAASQTDKWVVLDGDIDAVWIESMNTVMDDNKMLTLVSNERIPLSESMRMVFEVHSLRNATPATVSRAGILYMNDTDIGYLPYVHSWLLGMAHLPDSSELKPFFEVKLEALVEFFRASKMETVIPLPSINMVQSVCQIFEGILATYTGERSIAVYIRVFAFAAMWSFGGALSTEKLVDYKRIFSSFMRELITEVKFPDEGVILDYSIDFSTGAVVPWSAKLPSSGLSGSDSLSHVFVKTMDSVRLSHLADVLVKRGVPVMFVGAGGTGKTVLVNHYLSTLASSDDKFKYATINMNYYTDSLSLQRLLEQNIDKRSGKTYGPPTGRMIFFVDDLNLPCVEEYGTQTPMALMRQHIDYSSWYDRTEIGLKKSIVDCQYIACMNQKNGSFFIDPRLQRHFVTFGCNTPGDAELTMIFGSILSTHLFHFDKKIQNLADKIVDATIVVHKEVQAKFLPSAVKFHYNFTMREVSSVFRGILNAKPQAYKEPALLARLWYHEVMRVYSDRLMSEMEIQRCREIAVHAGKGFIDDSVYDPFTEPCVFTNFIARDKEGQPLYLPCEDSSALKTEVERQLSVYNESNPIMNLVFFQHAIQHVARICRIMFNGTSALFCGVGGSGKQSLSKLACFICKYTFVQLSMSNEYNITNFKEDLRVLFHKAAIKPAEPIMFLLNDDQILDERFLVSINDLLSTGRVADLFSTEEYYTIFSSLRGAAKAEGVPDNRDSMMNFFTSRIKANLLVVLCLSPIGEQFRQRARRFPGIFNCTNINWLHEWPKDALISVAQKFLKGMGGSNESTDLSDSIAYHMAEVHLSVGSASLDYLAAERRYNYTTPKSFLELISFYRSLLHSRRAEVDHGIKRLVNGLDTLMRTNQDVLLLQEALKGKKVEVEAKKAASDALLEEMGQQRAEAEVQQALADAEKVNADLAAAEARKLEEQAADDLAIAKPALDAANDAVHCLDKASMTELKSFNKPPAGVDKVTAALLIMIRGEKKDFSWENAKKMMAKVDAFKEKLETYRGEDIPEDVVTRVMPFLHDSDFTYDKMKSKSAAAANLCNWVVNIISFNSVYKRVKPLMESLDVASKAKRRAESDLAQVEESLAIIEGKLSKLQSAFVVATQEKAAVESEAKQCSDRLYLAERLTTGLGSERERWVATVEGLKLREDTLAGDVMLAAAFTSYVGAFSAPYRLSLWKDVWLQDLLRRDVPLTPNTTPLTILADESTIAGWQNEGLPADKVSYENGAILTNCNRWPLLIDPQLQGIKWLRKHEEAKALANNKRVHVCQQSDQRLQMKLVDAIRAGDTLIIENIGEVFDAALRSIIAKAMYKKGRTLYIKIGDLEVEYDAHFKLYLQTKMSSPHYKPEIFANCTLINFIVTKSGLDDQLLAVIVSEEEPALEKTKNELVQAFNTYKIQLKNLEDNLLERLASAPADILGDIPLIEGLEATKETADEVSAAVERGKIAEVGINEAREVYRGVAGEAALLYFIMLQLCAVDHMYQYSLDSFAKFFIKAIRAAAPAEGAARVLNLQKMLRWTIYRWVVRGLFERHRLMFLTQLTLGLLQKDPVAEDWGYSAEALRFLLVGPRSGEEKSVVSWLSDADWSAVKALSTMDGFEKLALDVEENAPRFLEWYLSLSPETEKLPGDYRELDKRPFLKLLVIRILRPDRMTAALSNFISHYIPDGKEYLECDSRLSAFQVLESSFEDSNSQLPVYFLLSPGADIASNIDRLAAKMGKQKGHDYFMISLGQGQEEFASEKLETGKRLGHWIFLDNVHLMPRWLAVLEKKLDDVSAEGTHPGFRVLLSSDPTESIPVAILNRCIKITSDPPTGMKPNLKQALASFPAETFNDLEPRSRGILFGLCQFHAIMVERKKFGSKGFNMMYPFAIGDLVNSAAVLRNYMECAPVKIPWLDLRYIFGEIMYGGHIINDLDRLIASTYLEFYMREELLSEMSMFPFNSENMAGFRASNISDSYDRVLEHIEDDFSDETPSIFGLHPNAEIGYRTQQCSDLLQIILQLSSSSEGGGLDSQNAQQVTETIVQDILDNLRGTSFDVEVITHSMTEIGPFQNFLLQECQRMNLLLDDVARSLVELDQGFRGELMMSDPMEALASSLVLDRVPKSWESFAYPSLRNLGGWLTDLHKRIHQLSEWVAFPYEMPRVVWISGLFNPQCFLTAVTQIASQAQGLELDKLSLLTEVTRDTHAEEIASASKEGANIIGLFLEGASWNVKNSVLDVCKPKQMFSPLPIIFIKPAVVDKQRKSSYSCPVYKTLQRGPTFVFSIQLRSNTETGKWVLAGVAAIMDVN